MLVLSRKLNEKIRLGDEITVTVLRVSGNTIRLGIDAPRDVRVLRGELEPRDEAKSSLREVDKVVERPVADAAEDEPDWPACSVASSSPKSASLATTTTARTPRVAGGTLADFMPGSRKASLAASL